MRIILDTNVLVSALLKPFSKPAKILRLVIQGDLQIIVNEYIVAEYQEVLQRPKFDLNMEKVQIILDFLRSKGIMAPAIAESYHLPDTTDEPFLEAARAAGADFLVTGNTKHFPKEACKGQKIVSPDQFLTMLARETAIS